MLFKKFIEKRRFYKDTIKRLNKYYDMDKKKLMMVVKRNWKIKQTRLKQKRGVKNEIQKNKR